MTQTLTLLELRNKTKEKKPEFIRQDYQRRKRLGRKLEWRKPKGIHSKIRHHFKGRRKMPSPGYKSPIEVRGLHTSGLKIIHVSSIEDIEKIKKEMEGVVLSKSLGMKKRLEIFKKARELNASVLNLNVEEQIKKIEDFINSKKKTDAKETKKETTKENQIEEIKEQKAEKQQSSDETKKEVEKKEKDKILTKRT